MAEEEDAVPAVLDRCVHVEFRGEVEAGGPGDGGELGGQIRERHELLERLAGALEVEAEEAGRVALLEAAEEGRVGDVAEPALADERGADEAGGEGDADEDLDEEIVVVEHGRDGSGGGRRRHLALHLRL